MGVKRTSTDAIFSDLIREAANWHCQAWGVPVLNGGDWTTDCDGPMECAHIHTRRIKILRHDPDNALCLCSRHHRWFSDHPAMWGDFVKEIKGPERIEGLMEKRQTIKVPSVEKEIRAHYRAELNRIRELREQGEKGVIQIEPWVYT